MSCDPIEYQEFIPIKVGENTDRKNPKRYSLTDKKNNNFDKKNGIINLMIPITEKKLKAKYCEDVSSDSLASIIVVLDGNQGKKTNVVSIIEKGKCVSFSRLQISRFFILSFIVK